MKLPGATVSFQASGLPDGSARVQALYKFTISAAEEQGGLRVPSPTTVALQVLYEK